MATWGHLAGEKGEKGEKGRRGNGNRHPIGGGEEDEDEPRQARYQLGNGNNPDRKPETTRMCSRTQDEQRETEEPINDVYCHLDWMNRTDQAHQDEFL